MNKRQNTYYLGLYDLNKVNAIDKNGLNVYNAVDSRDSGNQEYFGMLNQNLQQRGNWYKINDKQAQETTLIDFSFTNWSKIQTHSVIHNRILLDLPTHFISNKSHYYEIFKNEDFIPCFINIINYDNLPDIFDDTFLLKPSTGSLSIGIKIITNKCTKKEVIQHMNYYTKYNNWLLTELYIAKRWTDGCIVSNRIYYLVTKTIIKDRVIVTGYWFDEMIHYKACQKYNNNEMDYNALKPQLITNLSNNETTAQDFFNKRVLTHAQYLTLFTEDEYKSVSQKITNYLHIITKKIAEHVTCSNDYITNYNDTTGENKNMSFHLYGVDSLIMDNLDIKFIEINGAPSIIYDAGFNHINYSILFNELLKLTVDTMYPPTQNVNYFNIANSGPYYGTFNSGKTVVKMFDRKFIDCGTFEKKLKIPIYISKQICDTYPFISNALFNHERTKMYQRIKNPHSDKIFLFYGLRDRYIHPNSSSGFYDELIEYRISNNGRNAKILNKIQGITYYLASKDKLLYNCLDNHFMPQGFIFNVDTDQKNALTLLMSSTFTIQRKYIIIKPVYGSQGKGIIILPFDVSIDTLFNNMLYIKLKLEYNTFIISEYIDNPKLYTDPIIKKHNIKFNLRFYTFLHIKHIPTFNNPIMDIQYYTLNDVQIYFAALPYDSNVNDLTTILNLTFNNEAFTTSNNATSNNATSNAPKKCNDNYFKLYEKFKQLSLSDINNLINLTNLQFIKNISNSLNIDANIERFVSTLENMNYSTEFKTNVWQQANDIIKITINSVKQSIRHLNRFVGGSTAFNLIAYDTMLDADNKLHLIEINRGPDLHGLKITLGENKITDIFTELFDIIIDNKHTLTHFTPYML